MGVRTELLVEITPNPTLGVVEFAVKFEKFWGEVGLTIPDMLSAT